MANTVNAEFTVGNRKALMVLGGIRDFQRFRDFLRVQRTTGDRITDVQLTSSASARIALSNRNPEQATVDSCNLLFAEICNFPLVHLHLSIPYPQITLPLAATIRATKATLRSLSLINVTVDDHMDQVETALRKHPNLQIFELRIHRVLLNFTLYNRISELSLEGLVKALALCPLLKSVVLMGKRIEESELLKPAIQRLCQNRRLSHLQLGGPVLNGINCLPKVLDTLQTSNFITVLRVEMRPNISVPTQRCDLTRAMCDFLTATTSLAFLRLAVGFDGDTTATVLKALKRNSSVRRLDLLFWPLPKPPGLDEAMLEALSENCILQDIRVAPQNNEGWICPLCTLLNPLSSIVCVACEHSRRQPAALPLTNPAIKFYLRMNQQDFRRTLMKHGDTLQRHHWIKCLAAVSHCPSTLFHFLSMKPSLCECHGPANERSTSRASKRQRIN